MTTPRTGPPADFDVEGWNDQLAHDHDIDDYYERSSGLIRFIERRRLELIRKLLAPRPNERILEVGCGGGHVLRQFPECDLVGVDVSGKVLDKARANLAGYRVDLKKGLLGDVGLPPASFDGIICTEVLEHIERPEPVLEQMRDLVKPTGRLVITFPNDHLINFAKRTVRKLRLADLPTMRGLDSGGERYHLHVWSMAEMRALLSRYGVVVDEAHAPSRLFPVRCCFLVRPRH